jgi:hypothetical protein
MPNRHLLVTLATTISILAVGSPAWAGDDLTSPGEPASAPASKTVKKTGPGPRPYEIAREALPLAMKPGAAAPAAVPVDPGSPKIDPGPLPRKHAPEPRPKKPVPWPQPENARPVEDKR